jgi:phosphoribosylanthranilate isomerase
MRKQSLVEAERHQRSYGELILLAGNTRGHMQTERADLKVIQIRPGESTSFHYHLVAESLFHMLSGELLVRTGDEAHIGVVAGDTFIIKPGEPHQLINVGSTIAEVLEVESPPHDSTDKYLVGAEPLKQRTQREPGRFWQPGCHTRIKICGVRSIDAAYNCFDLGVDAIGLHAFGPHAMQRLREWSSWLSAVPPDLSIFLLTKTTNPVELADLARWAHCDTVQLQGYVPAEAVRRSAAMLHQRGWKVVKSLGVADLGVEQAYAYAREIEDVVDALLFDTTFRGGTGVVHDWAASAELGCRISIPVVLAGGLNPSNVGAAIGTVKPYGVDVEGGVEIRLGEEQMSVRSYALIKHLVEATRDAFS